MNSIVIKKERESSYELIRIIAQVFIVYYHILLFAIYPLNSESLYKAIWLPFHVGVPVFVMLSGYFGIKPSVKGLVKLIGMVFILQIPIAIQDFIEVGGQKLFIKGFFCISRTEFWFIRTYVILYLLSPLLNSFLKGISLKRRLLLFLALFFISDYIGTVGTDPSLYEGYNIVTFMMFYVVGDTIHRYKEILNKFSFGRWMTLWAIYNITLVALYTAVGFNSSMVNLSYICLFFNYTSPGLLLSSTLFFIAFGKFSFHSKFVNQCAKASLAIYIIHGIILFSILNPIAERIYEFNDNMFFVLLGVFSLTIITVIVCIAVYWVLSPLWMLINKIADCTQFVFDKIVDRIVSKLQKYAN